MKRFLTKFFSPILQPLERGECEYAYKKSYRLILFLIGGLFFILAAISFSASLFAKQFAALIPVLVFFIVSVVCVVVAGLGSDRAVAKIWGSK